MFLPIRRCAARPRGDHLALFMSLGANVDSNQTITQSHIIISETTNFLHRSTSTGYNKRLKTTVTSYSYIIYYIQDNVFGFHNTQKVNVSVGCNLEDKGEQKAAAGHRNSTTHTRGLKTKKNLIKWMLSKRSTQQHSSYRLNTSCPQTQDASSGSWEVGQGTLWGCSYSWLIGCFQVSTLQDQRGHWHRCREYLVLSVFWVIGYYLNEEPWTEQTVKTMHLSSSKSCSHSLRSKMPPCNPPTKHTAQHRSAGTHQTRNYRRAETKHRKWRRRTMQKHLKNRLTQQHQAAWSRKTRHQKLLPKTKWHSQPPQLRYFANSKITWQSKNEY